jgi:replicative DNA helicase
MSTKVPPHNLDAERSVLGAILLDSETLATVADELRSDNFYSNAHELIFESVLELFHDSKPIDVITLTSSLKKKNKLSQVGGPAYLSELIASVPTSAHVKEYARLVKEASVRRNLIGFAGKLDEISREEERHLDEIMDELEGKVFSLSQQGAETDFVSAADLVEKHFELTEEYSRNPGALRGISTGMKVVDDLLGGLHDSDLIILAARPAVGKSSFAFDLARHAAIRENKAVGIFSLEMPDTQVIARLLSQEIKVPLWDLRMGRMSDAAYAKFAEGAGKFSESKLFVDDTPGVSVMQLRSKARKLKLEHGLDLLIIDYLQLMQGSGKKNSDNRATEVSEISRSLKILARELKVPVIALSQLNRSVESRNDHLPQLSDLRESGSIEQDADIVVFLSREKLFKPESERGDVADVIVAKHRNGPTGRVELKFEDKVASFVDL